MLDELEVEVLPGRWLRLTLCHGQVFERIAASDEALAEVTAANGTVSRLSDGADIAPETLIRNGPEPPVDSGAVPPVGPKVTGPSRPAR